MFQNHLIIDIELLHVPCGPKKVYDRVCSLIDFLSYILFLSIYTDNSFFTKMFLKLLGKSYSDLNFGVSGAFDNLTGDN